MVRNATSIRDNAIPQKEGRPATTGPKDMLMIYLVRSMFGQFRGGRDPMSALLHPCSTYLWRRLKFDEPAHLT